MHHAGVFFSNWGIKLIKADQHRSLNKFATLKELMDANVGQSKIKTITIIHSKMLSRFMRSMV